MSFLYVTVVFFLRGVGWGGGVKSRRIGSHSSWHSGLYSRLLTHYLIPSTSLPFLFSIFSRLPPFTLPLVPRTPLFFKWHQPFDLTYASLLLWVLTCVPATRASNLTFSKRYTSTFLEQNAFLRNSSGVKLPVMLCIVV